MRTGRSTFIKHRRIRTQSGLSLIELMIGLVVGLVVTGMAGLFLIGNLKENKSILIGLRLESDMRAAMDVVTRDLRRSGYWAEAWRGITSAKNYNAATDAYNLQDIVSVTTDSDAVEYRYDRRKQPITSGYSAFDDEDRFGFKLDNKTLKIQLKDSSGYQELTDPAVTSVEAFTVTPKIEYVPLMCAGVAVCVITADPSDGACPKITIRSYEIYMRAASANINTAGTPSSDVVTRELRSLVRLRNDVPAGSCS